MRYLALLSILLINTINAFSQNDTTLYFSSLGRIYEKNEKSSYYIIVKKQNNGSFIQTKKFVDKNSSTFEEQLEIHKVDDSTYSINSNNIKYSFLRRYSRVDTGYIIKEIRSTQTNIGFSKLIFPLIKSGTWYIYKESTKKIVEEYYVNNEMIGNRNWNDDGSEYLSNVFFTTETPIGYDNGDISKVSGIVPQYVRYPPDAQINRIEGRVIVQFVVMEDGTIDGARIIRGVYQSLDNEAIRALKELPAKWNPGTIRGKAVRAIAVIPIQFKLLR